MSERQPYTQAGFATMKEQLARALIEKWFYTAEDLIPNVTTAVGGSADAGFTVTNVSSAGPLTQIYHFPPVPAIGAGGTGEVHILHVGNQVAPEPVEDVWAVRYKPWFDAVDEIFQDWDGLPDEGPFHRLGAALETAGNPIRFDIADIYDKNAPGGEDATLTLAIDDMVAKLASGYGGFTVATFYDTYVLPLRILLAQQYWLTAVLAATAKAEGDLLHRARATVMEIGHQATEAARHRDGGGDFRTNLTLLGILAGIVGNLAGAPPAKVGGTLVAAGITAVDAFLPKDEKPDPVPKEFAGATAQEIADRVWDALRELNSQIVDEELASYKLCEGAADATYNRSSVTKDHATIYFNLPPPVALLQEDEATKIAPLDVNLADLRRVANDRIPSVTGALTKAATDVDIAAADSHKDRDPWDRPGWIGFTRTGPEEQWTAMLRQTAFVLKDTAEELGAAGRHLALAADVLERSDESARNALAKHTNDVEGIAEPDPERPRADTPAPTGPGRYVE